MIISLSCFWCGISEIRVFGLRFMKFQVFVFGDLCPFISLFSLFEHDPIIAVYIGRKIDYTF